MFILYFTGTFLFSFCCSLTGYVGGQICQDIDPNACVLYEKQNANMCSDPILSTTACPAYCSNCRMYLFTIPCHALSNAYSESFDFSNEGEWFKLTITKKGNKENVSSSNISEGLQVYTDLFFQSGCIHITKHSIMWTISSLSHTIQPRALLLTLE